ncbi:MAG: hypothetical protein ACRBG0_19320 [Lewinella sp.]|uniref:hypothetical protein n=1 Tax=Lewinella sp. TaxID=2004506 RepID=UPI003D6B291A
MGLGVVQSLAAFQAAVNAAITDGGENTAAEIRTLLLNVSESIATIAGDTGDLTAETTLDAASDYFRVFDASAGVDRKVLMQYYINSLTSTTSHTASDGYLAVISGGVTKKILLEDLQFDGLGAVTGPDKNLDYVIVINADSQKIRQIAIDDFAEEYGLVQNGGNTGSDTKIYTKVIDIGDWNMDSSASVSVTHGVTEGKIRGLQGIIRDDSDTQYYAIGYQASTNDVAFEQDWNASGSTTIDVVRKGSGSFDNTNFDSTSYNRGWITITYEG